MPLISVPTIESKIFQRYFETVWQMEANDNWSEAYERKKIIEEIMVECGYDSMAPFVMLCRSHDIIYDRTYGEDPS